MSTNPPMIPAEYVALVDDAAMFPPGNAPLPDAVETFRSHRDEPYAALVGPLVVGDTRLPELVGLVEHLHEPIPVTVVVSGGAGALEPAARWTASTPLLELRGLEIALRDLDDLTGAARRTVAAVTDLGLDLPCYVELPLGDLVGSHGWSAALDGVAAADLRLKLRTGGPDAGAFPSSSALADAIDAALDRELPFKCTAGLHHAVCHRAEDTGFEHHGFLNVLLAVRAALDGEDVVAVLEESDADAVVARARATGSEALTRARSWFTSFGCCGVTDPWDDLVTLGLVAT